MKIEIWIDSLVCGVSPIVYDTAISTYQRGEFFFVDYKKDNKEFVDSYPLSHVVKVSKSE